LKFILYEAVVECFCEISSRVASTKSNKIQSKSFVMSVGDDVDDDAQPGRHLDVCPYIKSDVNDAGRILKCVRIIIKLQKKKSYLQ
jgi:hypothetical protein